MSSPRSNIQSSINLSIKLCLQWPLKKKSVHKFLTFTHANLSSLLFIFKEVCKAASIQYLVLSQRNIKIFSFIQIHVVISQLNLFYTFHPGITIANRKTLFLIARYCYKEFHCIWNYFRFTTKIRGLFIYYSYCLWYSFGFCNW